MIQVLQGSPTVGPGSTRILLDPSKTTIEPGWIYELIYHIPDWGIIDDIIISIIEWWKANVEGLDILGHYREGDNLIVQVRKKVGVVKMRMNGRTLIDIRTFLPIILGLAGLLILFGVVFLALGMRFATAGVGLLVTSLITFALASDWYKLLGVPLAVGGCYLIAKQAGAV